MEKPNYASYNQYGFSIIEEKGLYTASPARSEKLAGSIHLKKEKRSFRFAS